MRILRLAAAIPHGQRLEAPMASATKVSPVCGSRVTVDIDLDAAGRVVRFGQEVRACALGQAAAAILGAGILGLDAVALGRAHAALRAFLKEGAALPADVDTRFPDLELFAPARAHPARHGSILLAFAAAAEAAELAAARQAA